MTIMTKKLPSFDGVAPGQTATCRVPSGYAFHDFIMRLGGNGSTKLKVEHLDEIRLIANGIVIQQWKGTTLDAANRFDRIAASNWDSQGDYNQITLTCVRNNLKTRLAMETTALAFGALNDPLPISTLTIEIDLSSSAPQGCSIEGWYRVSERPNLGGKPSVLKLERRFVESPSGAGEYDIANLPRTGLISRILISNPEKIEKVDISADSVQLWNRTRFINETIIKSLDHRDVQNDFFAIDTTEGGNGQDAFITSGVSDFRLKLYMTGAADLEIMVEYLSTLGN